MKESPPKQEGYLGKILDLYEHGSLKPGSVWVAEIKHDDWCDLLNGRGYATATRT